LRKILKGNAFDLNNEENSHTPKLAKNPLYRKYFKLKFSNFTNYSWKLKRNSLVLLEDHLNPNLKCIK
jgi:hypothetical protein